MNFGFHRDNENHFSIMTDEKVFVLRTDTVSGPKKPCKIHNLSNIIRYIFLTMFRNACLFFDKTITKWLKFREINVRLFESQHRINILLSMNMYFNGFIFRLRSEYFYATFIFGSHLFFMPSSTIYQN